LQNADLVDVWKGHRGKRPQTLVRLTDEGRQRFLEYIDVLEQIVSSTLEAAVVEKQNQPSTRRGIGWAPT
jgi:DNA-binding PadR family transcriptional regulator